MATTFKFGNKNWAVKEDYVLAYNDENNNFKPLPFDFTRATTATYVDSDGLIKTANKGFARIDYTDNSDGHLLLEPSRTNLITYSEDFSEWAATNIVLTENAVTSPDGTTTADKIAPTSVTSQHRVNFTSSNASGATTFSFFAKSAEYNSCWARIGTSSAYFDLDNGVTGGTSSGITSSIEEYENDWYRCIMTKASSSANEVCRVNLTTSYQVANDFLGDNVSGIYLWGAQHEAGSYATSYIPTEGSSVTRNADVCKDAGSDQVINSTEGTFYVEIEGFISTDTVDQNRYITITNNTSNERVALLLGGNANQLRAIIYSSTQSINLSFTTSLTDVKQFNKLAVKYKSGDYAFFLNGSEIGSSTETSIFTANTLNDVSFDVGGGTQQFRGKLKDMKIYNTALSDSELKTLTT